MQQLFERVSGWNAARYEREYNHKLAVKLLREEYTEWLNKTDLTNEVKELSDITFVALGVLWKLGVTDEENQVWADHSGKYVQHIINIADLAPGYYMATILDMMECDHISPLNACHVIAYLCQAQLLHLGIGPDLGMDCFNAICDSNDTKPVVKTASDVKANKDKGDGYRPAEPDLLLILNKAGLTECLSLVR